MAEPDSILDDDDLLSQLEAEFDDMEELAPSAQNILDKKSLKWLFVGGKGGVGKTTVSCCLSVQLSKVRESVLILSTDPAHNLSDAFGQKFSSEPGLVNGFDNLYAMEVDPTGFGEEAAGMFSQGGDDSFIKEIANAVPGIDEAMSFAQVMKLVRSMEFDIVVFDTAPTGHTLRLLQFPELLKKGLSKMISLKNKFSGMFGQLSNMMPGMNATPEEITDKMEQTQSVIAEVHSQFKNSDLTQFVCVCIPEFLSIYETERMVQELTKFEIDVKNIVVNQVLYPQKNVNCGLCKARTKMQQKYIDQILDLYEDFHTTTLPLQGSEIRGKKKLEAFGRYLVKAFDPSTDVVLLDS